MQDWSRCQIQGEENIQRPIQVMMNDFSNHGTHFFNGATWSTDVPTVPFQPQTRAELQAAVDLWVSDNATALSTYGEINNWDVSLITDMKSVQ